MDNFKTNYPNYFCDKRLKAYINQWNYLQGKQDSLKYGDKQLNHNTPKSHRKGSNLKDNQAVHHLH